MFGSDLLVVALIALLLVGGGVAAFLVMRKLDRIPMPELGDPEEIHQATGRTPKTPPPNSPVLPGSTQETREKIKNLHWAATCNVLEHLGVVKAPGMLRSMSEHTLDPGARARWLAQVLGHDPDAVFADRARGTAVRMDFLIETENHCVLEDFLDRDPNTYATLKRAIERQMANGHHDFRRKVAEGTIQLRDAETAIRIVYEFDASPEKLHRVSVLQTALNAANKRYMQQRSTRQARRSLRTAAACRAAALQLLDVLERLADADGKWMISRNALENMPEAERSETLSQAYQNARALLYRSGVSVEELQGLIGEVEKIAGDMQALAVRAGVPPSTPPTPPGRRSFPEIWKSFGLDVPAGKLPTLEETRQAYTNKFIQSVAERESASDEQAKERATERTRILQEDWERARARLTTQSINIFA